MQNLTHPGGRAVLALGGLSSGRPASRLQDDTGVVAVDLIDQLSFHAMESEPLMGLERSCFDSIHTSWADIRSVLQGLP